MAKRLLLIAVLTGCLGCGASNAPIADPDQSARFVLVAVTDLGIGKPFMFLVSETVTHGCFVIVYHAEHVSMVQADKTMCDAK